VGGKPAAGKGSVKVAFFGEVSLDVGGTAFMDGGTHGVAGHSLVIDANGNTSWERRTGSVEPTGKEGKGSITLGSAEQERLGVWTEKLWQLAGAGTREFYPPIEEGPPRWVWAIVIRRQDETRILEGGGLPGSADAPEPAREPLQWLAERVDGLAR